MDFLDLVIWKVNSLTGFQNCIFPVIFEFFGFFDIVVVVGKTVIVKMLFMRSSDF